MPESNKERMYVGWHDVELQVKAIVDSMILQGAKPRVIMGIGFGGLIPAAMIAYQFGKRSGRAPYVDSIYAHSYKGEKREAVVLSGIVAATERHERVNAGYMLIVDDIADSGSTLRKLLDYWPLASTAVLVHKVGSIVKPDFWGHVDMDQDKYWYVFPWENS